MPADLEYIGGRTNRPLEYWKPCQRTWRIMNHLITDLTMFTAARKDMVDIKREAKQSGGLTVELPQDAIWAEDSSPRDWEIPG